jgi:hypothetical protein
MAYPILWRIHESIASVDKRIVSCTDVFCGPSHMENLHLQKTFVSFQVLHHLVTHTHGKIIPPNQIQRLCRMTHTLVGTILQQ